VACGTMVIGVVVAVLGFLFAVGGSLCEGGDCPSPERVRWYAAFMYLGVALFVIGLGSLIVLAVRRRTRAVRRPPAR
jgi:hypothetical protein